MTRRPASILLALLLPLALLAAGCGDDDGGGGGGGGGEQSTLEQIKDRGKLVVGIKYDQPGFGLRTASGDFEGFDVEIARLLAKELVGDESKVEFKETPSKIRESAIIEGDVDVVIATYTINDERKEKVSFAGPYYEAGQDIMVRADETEIQSVKDLNGKKVCSVTGSTSIDNIKDEAPDADISRPFDTYSKCAEELKNGRVDAVTTDNSILYGLADQDKGAFKVLGDPFTEEPYGIGLKKGDEELRDRINQFLEEIQDNGEWQKAYSATVGKIRPGKVEPPAIES